MNEPTSTTGQTAPEIIVERFRARDVESCTYLAFQQTTELPNAVMTLERGSRPDRNEAQVLVRHNVDGECLAIVYVDGALGPDDDLSTMTAMIEVLIDARDHLAKLQEAAV
jgi:hypothetical protein